MPPSIIEQIREQQAWEQPKKSGSVGLIAGTIAAFTAGLLLVSAWGGIPALSVKGLFGPKQQATVVSHNKPQAVSIPTGGRMGTASESKLLRTCMPSQMGGAGMAGMDNKGLYNLLQTTDQMMSLAAITGAPDSAAGAKAFSMMWAEVADCVFRQNGYVLCEPDNRALAVEAVSSFIRQSAIAAAPEANSDFNKTMASIQGRRRSSIEAAVANLRNTRERVLSTLKVRVQEGRLIPSDFGFFAPGEITKIVRDTKATSDACASRS